MGETHICKSTQKLVNCFVGYQNYEGDWFVSVAPAFKAVAGDRTFTVADKLMENEMVGSDTISIFNPETWDFDIYAFKGYDSEGKSLGWTKMVADLEAQIENPEAPMIETDIASFEIAKGETFYYQPSDGISGLTMAGEVESTEEPCEITFSGNWIYELANPYPIATTLGDLETFFKAMDTLSVFNPETWDFDIYAYNGTGNGWTKMVADLEAQIENPEAPMIEEIVTDSTTVVLPAGKGAYYQPSDENVRVWNISIK